MQTTSATTATTVVRTATAETIALPLHQLHYLRKAALRLAPHADDAASLPQVIRAILELVEASGADLSEASSEREVARLAARAMRAPRPLPLERSR